MATTAVTPQEDPHAPAAGEAEHHITATGLSNTKIAMWAFLGSDCLLFGALSSPAGRNVAPTL